MTNAVMRYQDKQCVAAPFLHVSDLTLSRCAQHSLDAAR